jgi:hypothetical protein
MTTLQMDGGPGMSNQQKFAIILLVAALLLAILLA